MQNELEKYRSRKKRADKLKQVQKVLKSIFMGEKDETKQAETTILIQNHAEVQHHSDSESGIESDADTVGSEEVTRPHSDDYCYKYTLRLLYFLLWATVYAIAIQLQFGIVYFMFSLLIGIYVNTRTGPKKSNEISAYSVFNQNCESIDGTLKAEQFEREMGYRAPK